ncbi:MAG: pyruvate dehydrogenase complex dihydrolipoamide acetyltransferase [Pseudomonadota bacterium]
MPINITMPALSPTMEEGTLAKWLKAEGDEIESGDLIAEIETDKATMEVEAVDEGVLAKILIPEGTEGVKVNEVIAVIAEEGEDAGSVEATPQGGGEVPLPQEEDETDPQGGGEVPFPQKEEAETAGGEVPFPMSGQFASASVSGDRIKASPLARRIAGLKGIDLSALAGKGSGPHGRIVKKDVENYEPSHALATTGASAPASPDGLILPQVLDDRVYDPESYELVPLDGMRKTVAKRLTQSFMQVPHFPLNVDLKLDNLLSARKNVNAAAPDGIKVSVNDMIIKAAALALMDEPDCNASYTDNGIAYHRGAHISVAVAIDGGLITPVLRNAHLKGLAEISHEMKDLATRARERKLKPQEYMGGTFSLSNLGMFGIKNFASIINPPEGMIMSVGAGEKKPVVGENDELTVATIMSVTLTCDHRVIGGAEGAKWLAAFKRYIEMPESMLL